MLKGLGLGVRFRPYIDAVGQYPHYHLKKGKKRRNLGSDSADSDL